MKKWLEQEAMFTPKLQCDTCKAGLGISNKISTAKENTTKLKKLLDTPGEDKMGNQEMERCNLCENEIELCGTYLTTRVNTYIDKTKRVQF